MEKIELPIENAAALFGQSVDDFKAHFVADGKVLESTQIITKFNDLHKAETARLSTAAAAAAKRDRMSEFETAVKTKYGYTGSQQGEALIDAILTPFSAKTAELLQQLEATKGKKLESFTPDEAESFVKNSNLFKSYVEKTTAESQTFEQKIKDINQAHQIEKVQGQVISKGITFLDSLNPILNEDVAKANAQKELFFNSFSNKYRFSLNEQGLTIPIDSLGNPLQDSSFRPITFEQLLKLEADKVFSFQVQGAKGSVGNGGNGGNGTTKIAQSDEEYYALIASANTASERAAIKLAHGK